MMKDSAWLTHRRREQDQVVGVELRQEERPYAGPGAHPAAVELDIRP